MAKGEFQEASRAQMSLLAPLEKKCLIWLARRFSSRLRPGDLLLVFFIWYGAVRFAVESLKADNWTFFGVPTAQIIAAITVVAAAVILIARHARPSAVGPPDVAEVDRLSGEVLPPG